MTKKFRLEGVNHYYEEKIRTAIEVSNLPEGTTAYGDTTFLKRLREGGEVQKPFIVFGTFSSTGEMMEAFRAGALTYSAYGSRNYDLSLRPKSF